LSGNRNDNSLPQNPSHNSAQNNGASLPITSGPFGLPARPGANPAPSIPARPNLPPSAPRSGTPNPLGNLQSRLGAPTGPTGSSRTRSSNPSPERQPERSERDVTSDRDRSRRDESDRERSSRRDEVSPNPRSTSRREERREDERANEPRKRALEGESYFFGHTYGRNVLMPCLDPEPTQRDASPASDSKRLKTERPRIDRNKVKDRKGPEVDIKGASNRLMGNVMRTPGTRK
jgi:hypothetical protein